MKWKIDEVKKQALTKIIKLYLQINNLISN